MAEFNIPGLKEAIKDVEKYQDAIEKAAKSTLALAIEGEKAAKAMSGTGLKQNVELTKTAKAETDKLEAAKEKLNKLQSQEAVELAKVNLLISEQVQKNKALAASESETATALQKFNAQLNDATKKAKELGAEMVLLEQEGKKNTAEYKRIAEQFAASSTKAKELNDRYREISKTAGDNRALVGSYSDELKGHFETINSSVNSLKNNISSGNIGGVFNDARAIVVGFGQAVKKGADETKGVNDEVGKSAGVFANLKTKASDATKATVEFFKPSQENSQKLTEGLERVKIGFTGNNEAVNKLKASQAEANGVADNANSINQKGGIISNLFARGQMALSGATGVASGAFNILRVAIASTGIGLVVIIIAALVNYMMKLDPVMDKIEQGFAAIGGVIDFITEKVGSFIEGIKSVGDLMSKLGDIILHPIDSLSNLADGMEKAAVAAANLKKREQDLADQMDIASVKNKVQESEIARLMIQAKDRTLTEEQRQAAFEKAEKLNNEIYQRNKVNATEALNIAITEARKKHQLNGDMIADLQKLDIARANSLLNDGKITKDAYEMLKDAFDKNVEVQNQYNEQLDKITTKKNNALEKSEAKAEAVAKAEQERQKKSAEIQIGVMKITLDNLIATYDQTQHLDAENVAHIQAISLMKQSIAKAEMEKNLIGVKKGSLDEIAIRKATAQEIEKIENEKSKAINKVTLDRARFELELYDLNNKSILDDAKMLTDKLVEEEKRRLKETLQVHKDAMREELGIDKDTTDEKLKIYAKTGAQLTANELKYLQFITKEEAATNKEIKKNDDALLQSKLKANSEEEKDSVRHYRLLQRGTLANNIFELREEEKRIKKDLEIVKQGSKEEEKLQDDLAENQQKLQKIVSDSKIKGFQDSLTAFIAFAGQESAVGKLAAVSQTTINTYEGASRALKDYPAPYSYIVAGLTIANGLRSVAQIEGISLFAEGTDYAPYTGKAIVDEEGPELRFDKHGRLKSLGSDGGANMIDIVKGDRIIPADVSAIIRQTMFAGYASKEAQAVQINYDEIGKQFGKHASKIVNAVNSKSSVVNVAIQKNLRVRATFKGNRA
jgi:DNA repair exonuclease SbcCD ATPase subunit